MNKQDWNDQAIGVRMKYQGNVVCCNHYLTMEENKLACMAALAILTGYWREHLFGNHIGGKSLFETDGGTVERYRSY